MSTPEIDLHNMLMFEDQQEALDDSYIRWMEYDVLPDLTKYLAAFDYDKFDSAVSNFKIFGADPIVSWIFGMITDDYDVYYAFMMRNNNADDVDFAEIAETYLNCFICQDHFLEYIKSQGEW